MTDLTVVIPYAPAHAGIVDRAVASVHRQTVPTEIVLMRDEARNGVAWARNEGVRRSETPLVAFLDADDILEPTYTERMVAVWEPQHYVYCDMYHGSDKRLRQTKDCFDAMRDRRHAVTCVISVRDFWQAGGFDEDLLKAEDVDFWFRCHARGIRSKRCPYPLFHYTRSDSIRAREHRSAVGPILQDIYIKYGSQGVQYMGCCGDDTKIEGQIMGTQEQQHDILVRMTWGGNRTHTGKATGRSYPRNGNNKLGWVDPRDQQASPELYQIVEQPTEDVPADDADSTDDSQTLPDFDAMYKYDLTAYADEHGIEYLSADTREDVLAKVRAYHGLDNA